MSKLAQIYYEPEMENLPVYYDRDIIKILTKNPKEVFIFWGISQSTLQKIREFFGEKDNLDFKLYLRYQDEKKNPYFQEILLPPFTTSYVVKFLEPVFNLRAEVLAYCERGEYSLMHSAHVNMPVNKPSLLVHKDWINPKWIKEGFLTPMEGETYEIRNYWQEAYGEEKQVTAVTERFDGSSGGYFSSHLLVTSSRGNW
ncbi:MAG: DUF4912 domain-containing protein [Leptospiraceae bacterium]|nr:DUF4912 domain-containing protein [Leptospiraceae bacterium]